MLLDLVKTRRLAGVILECKGAGIEFDAYAVTTGDQYSLPNIVQYLTKPSKMDLLISIMEWALPKRKSA